MCRTTIINVSSQVNRFYSNYEPMEGVITAVVLGGFFAFVCLLVIYKTKCKPMWKNRRKRLTNTPATQSMADGNEASFVPPSVPCGRGIDMLAPVIEDGQVEGCCVYYDEEGDEEEDEDQYEDLGDQYEFECIPLRSVFTGGGGGGAVDNGIGRDDEEGDIYFLDEYGNYVFPVAEASSGNFLAATPCSCQPSTEDVSALWKRRQSQVGDSD